MRGPVVRARGLEKTYGRGRAAVKVLDGADLDVVAGELVAVFGRSGSGKSTLLHLLGGLDAADAGTIEVAGTRLDRAREAELVELRRQKVGFVFPFGLFALMHRPRGSQVFVNAISVGERQTLVDVVGVAPAGVRRALLELER